jgi:hypothetical protein
MNMKSTTGFQSGAIIFVQGNSIGYKGKFFIYLVKLANIFDGVRLVVPAFDGGQMLRQHHQHEGVELGRRQNQG